MRSINLVLMLAIVFLGGCNEPDLRLILPSDAGTLTCAEAETEWQQAVSSGLDGRQGCSVDGDCVLREPTAECPGVLVGHCAVAVAAGQADAFDADLADREEVLCLQVSDCTATPTCSGTPVAACSSGTCAVQTQ